MTAPSPPPSLLSAGELEELAKLLKRCFRMGPATPSPWSLDESHSILAAYRAQEAQLASAKEEIASIRFSEEALRRSLVTTGAHADGFVGIIGQCYSDLKTTDAQLADLRAQVERQEKEAREDQAEIDALQEASYAWMERAKAAEGKLREAEALPLPPDLGERK